MSGRIDQLNRIEKMSVKDRLVSAAAELGMLRGMPEAELISVEDTVTASSAAGTAEGGQWMAAPCWHNCGGKCLVRACVKDGVILRQKTDDISTDNELNRQQRACLRGFSQQYQARGTDRLKYPMKRRHWSPEERHPELRGKDEWERITWEEAADYIHDEIVRITERFGDQSILLLGNEGGLLRKLGVNYLSPWSTSSWGTWYASGVLGWSDGCNYYDCNVDRLDMRNADYVVAFGYNPAWSALGNATNYAVSWKNAGVRFILFDPFYTETASVLDATWIPIRPGTDMAAMMAMSQVLLEEDDHGSLIDWDFLDRCCVGQDAEHMPGDAESDENYFDYLRGRYDGIPKTPEWAETITGIPAQTLRETARILGRRNNVAILSSWASARTYNTEQLPQTAICLAAMGGHIGKSGNCVGPTGWNHTNNYGPRLIRAGSGGDRAVPTGKTGRAVPIPESQLWDAVLGKPFNPTGIFQEINEAGPKGWKQVIRSYDLTKRAESVTADVRMIWSANKAKLTTTEGAKKGIEAFRSVEFVVGQGHFLTATNRYADIVLPVTTHWEREYAPIGEDYMNRDLLLMSRQVVPPFYESRSDVEASITIGRTFGLKPEHFTTVPPKQQLFNSVVSSAVLCGDGITWENLVSVNEEDIRAWGVEGIPQNGRIPLSKFMEDGMYRMDRWPGDPFVYIDKIEFREDPEGHPIDTASGKVEFACRTWADILNSQGFSEEEYSAIPKYRPPAQGYEACFENGRTDGIRGTYPLQCISLHYRRRSHSVFDNIPWLREAMENPCFLSRKDAQERGIRDGDTVKISSRYGETLRPAYVTERLMPGVVGLPHGPWMRVDEADGIDRAGAENYITGGVATGMGCSGYNTLNVEVSLYEADTLPADREILQTAGSDTTGE